MNYTVITGASSGIGKELARVFAKAKHNLILIARREELLKELKEELEKEVCVQIIPYDLSNDLRDLYQQLDAYKIDVLINNAGVGLFEEFKDSDLKTNLNMIDLNIKVLVSLTHYFLKDRTSGHIINVGSIASFVPGPYMSVYYASKAFVLSFSEALKEELPKEIKVTVVCPGPTRSEFSKIAKMEKTNIFNSIFTRSAQDVAYYTYKLYKRNRVIGIDGIFNRIGIFLTRLFPRSIVRKAVLKIQGSTNHKI